MQITDALESMPATCALDVAGEHPDGLTLEQVAQILGLTRERVRQIEEKALAKMARASARAGGNT